MLNVSNYNVILASKSPRRQELLKSLVKEFIVLTKEVEEIFPENLQPEDVATYLSELKAKAFRDSIEKNELIITADTVVINDNKVLGKPVNANEALKMLTSLSNKSHEVITGVTLLSSKNQKSFQVSTKVFFKQLSINEINHYIEHYQPFDKAGAYGIQEWIGQIGITKIEGCYYNVMGLPLQQLYEELNAF